MTAVNWKKLWKTVLARLRNRTRGAGTGGRKGLPDARMSTADAGNGRDRAAAARLLEELRAAHQEWACARHRLDYVLGDDEIDYAIFALETAEKRYGMLLKQAKSMKISGRGIPSPPVKITSTTGG